MALVHVEEIQVKIDLISPKDKHNLNCVYFGFNFAGGGFSLLRKNRWTLRGIVSAGLNDINTGGCMLTEYVVFTDVSKFTDWIKQYM